MKFTTALCAILLSAALATSTSAGNEPRMNAPSLIGTWHLASLYDEDADGEEASTFGLETRGRLVLDDHGHFAVQIVDDLSWGGTRCDRGGVAATRASAASGTIAYYGSYEVDRDMVRFRVEAELSPQRNVSVRVAEFSLAKDRLELISSVLPSLTGSAYSHLVWRRME